MPLIVIGAVFVIYVVGGLLSSVVIRSGAYAKLITVETGDFTQDIEEISFDQIPMLDRDRPKSWVTANWASWPIW